MRQTLTDVAVTLGSLLIESIGLKKFQVSWASFQLLQLFGGLLELLLMSKHKNQFYKIESIYNINMNNAELS